MMTPRLAEAMTALHKAHMEFLNALQAAFKANDAAAPPVPARARKAAPEVKVQLPESLTKDPNALSDETRAASLVDAVKAATDTIRAVGPDSVNLRQGVMGALALRQIPYDMQLVDDAIAQAKAAR